MKNRIPFYKMHGGGNDFVLIDHRARFIPEAEQPRFARRVCHRQLGAGADGLILIEASPTANFRWRFYNADGSEPEMCGNGGRCAARFAVLNGIAPADLSFETLAGTIKAEVKGRLVKLLMAGVGDFILGQTIPLEDNHPSGPFPQGGRAPRGGAGRRPGSGPRHRLGPGGALSCPVCPGGDQRQFHPGGRPANLKDSHLRAGGGRRDPGLRHRRSGLGFDRRPPGPGSLPGDRPHPGRRGPDHIFYAEGGTFSEVYLEGDALVTYQGELWVDELK